MLTLLLSLLACKSETGTTAIPRHLESFPYVDAGAVAPLDRRTFIVPLFSLGETKLRVFDLQVIDDGGEDVSSIFTVDDAWRTLDSDGDGVGDAVEIEAYNEDGDDDTLPLPVVFAPPAEGFYSAVMTIWSDDNETKEKAPLPSDPNTERGIWRVQLRGIAQEPCSRVLPVFVDFGKRPSGGQFTDQVLIENCGLVRIDVAQAVFDGSVLGSVESGTLYPLYVLPGEQAPVDLRFTASSNEVSGTLHFVSNAPELDAQSVDLLGNTCASSIDSSWDEDGDGWSVCGGDCDDTNYAVSPSAFDRAGNLIDDDCDGEVDEAGNPTSSDDDGDGCNELGQGAACGLGQVDCDDADAAISPVAVEVEDGIDNNCNGKIDDQTAWWDDDLDGHSERQGDCNDASVLVDVDVAETPDGVDNDCDGLVDEGGPDFDDDRDGTTENQGDCDDGDPWTYEGAFEFCDFYDNDCDLIADEGPDDELDGACAFLPERGKAH